MLHADMRCAHFDGHALDQRGNVAVSIDTESPMPLYYQIQRELTERIVRGDYSDSGKLPSESQLQAEFNVGRATIRKAIDELAKRGLVVKHHGKGVFLAPPKMEQHLLSFYSFTDEMIDKGFTPSTEVLEFEYMTTLASVARALGLQKGTYVIRIVRVRSADDEPLIYETSYLPASLVPGLTRERVSDMPLYEIIEKDYGLRLSRAVESFEPVNLGPYEARILGVPAGIPALFLERTAYSDTIPVEFCQGLVRGDRCRYQVDLERP